MDTTPPDQEDVSKFNIQMDEYVSLHIKPEKLEKLKNKYITPRDLEIYLIKLSKIDPPVIVKDAIKKYTNDKMNAKIVYNLARDIKDILKTDFTKLYNKYVNGCEGCETLSKSEFIEQIIISHEEMKKEASEI
jgi:hypothetical protein